MKQKTFAKKLTLNKKTVVSLDNDAMNAARGGITDTVKTFCCSGFKSCDWPLSVCICPITDDC